MKISFVDILFYLAALFVIGSLVTCLEVERVENEQMIDFFEESTHTLEETVEEEFDVVGEEILTSFSDQVNQESSRKRRLFRLLRK